LLGRITGGALAGRTFFPTSAQGRARMADDENYSYLGVIGLLVLLLAYYDFLATTLVTSSSGIITLIIIRSNQLVSLWIHRHLLRIRAMLVVVGPLTVFSILSMWLFFFWLAWLLVFYSTLYGIVSSSTGAPAGVAARIYYTGYVISTLGIGDFVPTNAFFRIVTSIAAIFSFIQLCIVATWVLNISQGVTASRALALQIASGGNNPAELLLNSWNGKTFGSLSSFLSSISQSIAEMTDRQVLLPVTVTFYSHKRDSAEAVQIALVDEAIAILLFAVQNLESKGIDRFSLLQIRNVISVLIAQADTRLFLHSLSVSDAPIPDIRCLQSADIPIDAIEYSQSMQKQVARRHSLKRLVEQSGFSWEQVWQERKEEKSITSKIRTWFPCFGSH